MTTLAAAAAMTTPVAFEYRDAEGTAAASAREQLNEVILVDTGWMIPVVTRILELERLRANWDGYGTAPVDRDTATKALRLVGQIAALGVEDLPAPFVGPVTGGGIMLEWTVATRQLTVAILPEGRIEYMKCEASEPFEEEELRSIARAGELVSWLMRPA